MSASRDRQIVIELVVRSGHPSLLAGLDAWLQLGLISDDFVRQLCQEEFTCALPEVEQHVPHPDAELLADLDTPSLTPQVTARSTLAQRNPQPSIIAQALQAFMAEISVVWLLFLGVFLVVVSSGVLAATQWQNFAAIGQYGILFVYTLAFATASFWTRQNPVLQLTNRMLTIATLLLIPVNFWMMDGFRLWSDSPGISIAAIAAVTLTGIIIFLLKRSTSSWMIAGVVLLSWVHWGWRQPHIPLIASYLGTFTATAVLLFEDLQHQRAHPEAFTEAVPDAPTATARSTTTLSTITIALSAMLLIGRALFVALIPVSQLGLAIGGCGWLLGWLGRRDRARIGWSRAGTVLLLVGWLVTVGTTPPWQAIAISGLGLSLLNHALWRTGRSAYLATGFLVGFQLIWLSWRVLPSAGQTQVVDWATNLAGTSAMPFALLGIGFFPYVMFMAGFAVYLQHRDRANLAKDAEWLALALGALLVAVSFGNPLVRSLTLTLASLTLVTVTVTRQTRSVGLVHLAHGTALSSLFAWIHYGFPALPISSWVGILLGVMALEWAYSTFASHTWEDGPKSAWHFGLILAGVSYALLWNGPWPLPPIWKLGWLLTPMLLTGLAYRDRFRAAQLAGWLSVLALVLAQPVMFSISNTRLASLGMATFLMVLNTRKLQKLGAAVLTVGFGLAFWSSILWEVLRERSDFGWLTVWIALTVFLLWGLRGFCQSRRSQLSNFYGTALDGWAIAILLLAFLVISISQLFVVLELGSMTWTVVLAGGILIIATIYRNWQTASDAGWLAIAWSVELLVVSSLLLFERSLIDLAIANILLGFIAQIASNWQMKGRRQEQRDQDRRQAESSSSTPDALLPMPYPLSWHLIPLAYGLIGLWWAHHSFTATTGLFTLAVAVLGSQIGRRSPRLATITYLSLVGISYGAFELLIYQLSQAKGENTGDGLTLLAGLAIALTWSYHILQRQLVNYLRLTTPALEQFIQMHWVVGNGLLVMAVTSSLSRMGQIWWTVIVTFFAVYALVICNRRWHSHPPANFRLLQAWTYAGILELFAAIASLFWLWLPPSTLLDWAGAIAAILAVLFYICPWQQWGWDAVPWQQTSSLVPSIVILLTGWAANLQSLLMAAAFYTWLASAARQIRFSYIGLFLANWALIRLLLRFNITQPLWYAAIAGGSMLYLAQVDPELHTQERYEQRHWVRSLATALICLTGFYQAEIGIIGLSPFVAGFVAITIEFSFILLGIIQRVRAFLYVGTLTFIMQILWQLWRFIRDYSLLLWLVGIVVGLILIWVAATFEARRTQANALLQHWVSELEDWQ